MVSIIKFLLIVSSFITRITSSPWDNGKYNPKKYEMFDDGKYYRPLNEGKYIPGDEGRYTYIYLNGLYPSDDGDYRYIHVVGPNGGKGGDGRNGGFGNGGGLGSEGPGGPDEPFKRNIIEYIGRKIYAERYPYIHKVIKSLVDEYVSEDLLTPDGTANYENRVRAKNALAAKCTVIAQEQNSTEEFTTQYPPGLELKESEKLRSYYTFKGTKALDTVSNALTSKMRLEYEVIVTVVEDVTTVGNKE